MYFYATIIPIKYDKHLCQSYGKKINKINLLKNNGVAVRQYNFQS